MNLKKPLIFFFVGLLLLSLAFEHQAFSQGLPVRQNPTRISFKLFSRYTEFSDNSISRTQIWRVERRAGTGEVTFQFYAGESEAAKPVCRLCFLQRDKTPTIEWNGIGRKRKRVSAGNLLLVPGFPAPCDVLPELNEREKWFNNRREAGGQVFIRKYHLIKRDISLDNAREKGWISEGLKVSPDLEMREVVDEQGRLVVKQLWTSNRNWWIYEETPFRRSWLLP